MLDGRPVTNVGLYCADRFEDGTLPFLEILAVKHGFDCLLQLTGRPVICLHAFFADIIGL